MNAERRNRFLEIYFHLLLAFYSISGIGNSIIGEATGTAVNGAVLLYISILTLSISLLIFGFKFGEVAAQHRACYLDLQSLSATESEAGLSEKYFAIIENLPNHSEMDFLKLVIERPFSRLQALKKPNGDIYSFTRIELFLFLMRRLLIWMFLAFLTVPAFLVTYWNFSTFLGSW